MKDHMKYTWVVVFIGSDYYHGYDDTYYVDANTESNARKIAEERHGGPCVEIAYIAGPFVRPDDYDEGEYDA